MTDELVVTQEAIDTIAGAYEQAAGDFRDIADNFERTYSREPWGTLPSLLQLQGFYNDLALGEQDSCVVRLREYADAADRFAAWVRAGGDAILCADYATADELTAAGPQ